MAGIIRTGRGLCVGQRRNFMNANLGGSRFIYGYSSLSSVVVFCGSKGFGMAGITSGVFMNGGVLRMRIFGGGSGQAVCGYMCHSNGRNSCFVGQFGMATVAHSGLCSVARNAPKDHVVCFATGPGNRTRVVGIAVRPSLDGGHRDVFLRGSFSRVLVGKHTTGNGLLAGQAVHHVKLGDRKRDALKKEGI